MNVFELFASINLDDRQYNNKLKAAQGRLKTFGESAKRAGQTMSTRLTAPLVAIGGGIVAMSTQFDESMNRLQAITGETGEAFEGMRDLAQELGSTTQFSASQAAEGMGFLAQAGFDTQEIMEAIPGALELAAAGQLTLAEAADIASNVLGGFDMDPDEIGRVNDVLAETSSIANTNVRQLGDAMRFVAPVASGLGVPIEDASAAIGALSDVGIQGGEAGTALRNILTRLGENAEDLGVQMYDAEGNMRPFAEIIGDIGEQGFSTDEIMQMFGQRAGPALSALLARGEEGLLDLQTRIEASGGAAQEMAETQMQGLPGAFKELRSAVEGAGIALGDAGISELIQGIADRVSDAIRAFTNLEEDVQRNVAIIAGLLGAAGPIMVAIGVLSTAIGTITAPIAIVVGAVAAFAAAYATDFMGMREITNDFVADLLPQLESLFESLVDLWQKVLRPAWDAIQPYLRDLGEFFVDTFENVLTAVTAAIDGLILLIEGDFSGAFAAFQEVYQAVFDTMMSFIETNISILKGLFEELGGFTEGLFSSVGNALQSGAAAIASGVSNAFTGAIDSLRSRFDAFLDFVKDTVNRAKNLLDFDVSFPSFGGGSGDDQAGTGGGGSGGGVPDWVPDWFPGASDPDDEPDEPSGGSDQFQVPDEIGLDPTFPQMATGGIVREPTFALVGEAGPEAVVPLDRYDAQNMQAGEFGESVGVFGEFVRRLTQEGIRVQTAGGSRTAALR